MEKGTIIRGTGGFYDVKVGTEVFRCQLRGKFRQQMDKVLVGDCVEIALGEGDSYGSIERIMPRRTELVRPPIANIDQVLIIIAVKNPQPSLELLDRLLVLAESKRLEPIICLNKVDLDYDTAQSLADLYGEIPYKTLLCSAETELGVTEITSVLEGKVSAVAGPSGVGKSSLLNKVAPFLRLHVGEISQKLRRGKHTTRAVELITLPNGGLVADTPGFSQLLLENMAVADLRDCFPEFASFDSDCQFRRCLHKQEPKCGVRTAAQSGDISSHRYKHYLSFLQELEEQRHY